MNTIFRTEHQKDGKLGYAQKQLEHATDLYKNKEPIVEKRYRTTIEISTEDFLDARDVYSVLKDIQEYKIRVDPWRSLIIYSNDKDSLLKIANKMRVSAREFWEPKPKMSDFLLDTDNIIIVDTPPDLPYKVTLGRTRSGTTAELGKWIIANTDKSRAGSKALNEFLNNGWVDGLYFYVRDERILMLVQMMVGNKIRRIDKLVYAGNIDK
jgi:hypothetical protein